MHNRLSPKKHRFHYTIFQFYIDLDEIDLLRKKLLFFSHNRFNFFSLKDNAHLKWPAEQSQPGGIREQITAYLDSHGIDAPKRIMLLTNMHVMGYNFNPVSFYYCFDTHDEPLCAIAEVGNTFGEMKPYLLGKDCWNGTAFRLSTTKYFYVSPFIDHDASFDFTLPVPGNKLNIRIDDYKGEKRFFISTLTGTKKALNNRNLAWYSIRFPFITLKIITLIHWNALLLWLKKIPYHKKADRTDLQRDVHRRYKP